MILACLWVLLFLRLAARNVWSGYIFPEKICSVAKAAGILSAVRIQTALRQFRDAQTVPVLRCKEISGQTVKV